MSDDNEESLELVTVYSGSDIAELAVVKVALEAEGIRFIIKGEGVQDLLGLGRAFGGANLATGPVQIQVRRADAELALEILGKESEE